MVLKIYAGDDVYLWDWVKRLINLDELLRVSWLLNQETETKSEKEGGEFYGGKFTD